MAILGVAILVMKVAPVGVGLQVCPARAPHDVHAEVRLRRNALQTDARYGGAPIATLTYTRL